MTSHRNGIILVADAGGTGTDWWILNTTTREEKFIRTDGINAAVSTDEEIEHTLLDLHSKLILLCGVTPDTTIEIEYYGAACNTPAASARIENALRKAFGPTITVGTHSDLEGAAVALFGDNPGIACILGTGSASGYFDGQKIADTVPSLGYILGDEGSGAFMGKLLVNKIFKREFEEGLKENLLSSIGLTLPEIIEKVYRQPKANTFLASLVSVIKDNEKLAEISILIDTSLKLFFEKNVVKYNNHKEIPLGFVGGIASSFAPQIRSIASEYGLKIEKILHRPIEGLAQHHKTR